MPRNESLIYVLKFKPRSKEDHTEYCYNLLDGITKEIAMEINNKLDTAIKTFDADRNDFSESDTFEFIENILDDMGIEWGENLREDHVIYF